MSKPISAEQIAEFREYCRTIVTEDEKEGNKTAYFTIDDYEPFMESDDDGMETWTFQPEEDEDLDDFYKLFEAVSDEFEIEVEGHGSFLVSKK